MNEVVLEEKRREIIKGWINSGKIEDVNNKQRMLLGIRKILLKIKENFEL
jgi:hypothetical protein